MALAGAALFLGACSNPIGSGSSSPAPSGTAQSTSSTAGGAATSYTSVVNAVSPSIVLIETTSGLGSGIVYDSSGDIVTNAHVVGTATQFTVTASDGKQFQASLVGSYPPSDVAVIKVANPTDLHPVQFGNSGQLQVGQVVLAMGNPLGFQSSVTEGIVSGLGRTVSEPDGAVLTDVVQTSAAINPGNSGGGLVNLQDQIVGMPTLAAVDPQVGSAAPGIGFALSSNTVQDYANQIIKDGKVTNTHRAYLGVKVGDVQNPPGVVVLAVVPGGPSAQAGVQVGDIITAVNGQSVTSSAALSQALANLTPGTQATLTVNRNGQSMSLKVTLGTLPAA
jgi:S1-C subfamily serine protease